MEMEMKKEKGKKEKRKKEKGKEKVQMPKGDHGGLPNNGATGRLAMNKKFHRIDRFILITLCFTFLSLIITNSVKAMHIYMLNLERYF